MNPWVEIAVVGCLAVLAVANLTGLVFVALRVSRLTDFMHKGFEDLGRTLRGAVKQRSGIDDDLTRLRSDLGRTEAEIAKIERWAGVHDPLWDQVKR